MKKINTVLNAKGILIKCSSDLYPAAENSFSKRLIKKNLIFFISIIFLLAATYTTYGQTYCTPTTTYSPCQYAWITNVTIKTTGGSTLLTNSTGCSAYYNVFGSPTCTLNTNTTYNASFTIGGDGNPANITMWMDVNRDGTFAAGEMVINNFVTVNGTTSFTVPSTTSGSVRIRIKTDYYYYAVNDPCTGNYFGEVEDYTVTCTSASPCSGTPSPGNTIATANPVCSGVNFTLSLQNPYTTNTGITYQWQTSADGSSWSNVTGATAATYTTSQTTAAYYRCNVTCSGGGTGPSTALQVTMNTPSNCYCTPSASNICAFGMYITNVYIVGTSLNKNSNCDAPFINYPSSTVTATLTTGSTYTLNLTTASATFAMIFSVWMDANGDGTFSSGEKVVSNFQLTTSGSTTFTVPSNASGQVRMRVRSDYYTYPINDPCAATTYAETEDYTVTCSAPPASLTASVGSLSFGTVGAGANSTSQTFNLSGSNLTGYPANITVTAPAHFQVSNNNSTWGTTTTIAYSSATLSATPVYVRFSPTSGGAKSGNITFSGAGVSSPPTVAVSGTAIIISTSTGGNWNAGSTWLLGTVPVPGDNVYIADGAIVTLNTDPTIAGLNVGQGASGTLASDGTVHFIYLTSSGTPLLVNNGGRITGNNKIKIAFTNTGSVLFKAPVTSVLAECWGGGGGGGGANGNGSGINQANGTGGGGGGGAYTSQVVNGLTVNTSYSVTVGAGGAAASAGNGGNGGSSWFNTSGTVLAVGGNGGGAGIAPSSTTSAVGTMGAGGAAASCIPSANAYSGGNGAMFTSGFTTMAGGGGAGSTGAGGNATNGSAGSGAVINGGNGAAGVAAANPGNTGVAGNVYGGGGGGAFSMFTVNPFAGGAGAQGLVAISWYDCPTPSTASIMVVQNCASGNSVLSTSATGSLLWTPGGATTSSITVTTGGTYSVTATSNGCTSAAGTGAAVIGTTPATPAVTAVNNCNGTSTLSTTASGALVWSTSATTSSITISSAGTYSVTATSNGCVSAAGTAAAVLSSCSIPFTGKCFIQGYYLGAGKMSPLLKLLGLSTNANDVDTISVILHDSNSPYSALYTVKAILKTDGSISCSFPSAASGSYYIAISHRNSLETWSSTVVTVAGGYDFTTAASKAYGSNMADLSGGKYGIFSGDITQNGSVNTADKYSLQGVLSTFPIGTYNVNDITGDGFVDEDDYLVMENNTPLNIAVAHP